MGGSCVVPSSQGGHVWGSVFPGQQVWEDEWDAASVPAGRALQRGLGFFGGFLVPPPQVLLQAGEGNSNAGAASDAGGRLPLRGGSQRVPHGGSTEETDDGEKCADGGNS